MKICTQHARYFSWVEGQSSGAGIVRGTALVTCLETGALICMIPFSHHDATGGGVISSLCSQERTSQRPQSSKQQVLDLNHVNIQTSELLCLFQARSLGSYELGSCSLLSNSNNLRRVIPARSDQGKPVNAISPRCCPPKHLTWRNNGGVWSVCGLFCS